MSLCLLVFSAESRTRLLECEQPRRKLAPLLRTNVLLASGSGIDRLRRSWVLTPDTGDKVRESGMEDPVVMRT